MRAPTSDQEWAEYLRGSSDPDDRSLALRIDLVERLKRRRLNLREGQLLELLQGMNAVELGFLKQTSAYRISHDRPCWPRWHWPEEIEELFSLELEGRRPGDLEQ